MDDSAYTDKRTTVTVGLKGQFCQCGMVFFVPEWLTGSQYCPKCSQSTISSLNAQVLGQKKVIESLTNRLDRVRKEVKRYAHDLESGS